MLRQAAYKTGDTVRDGTGMATVLAHAIYAHGVRDVVVGASGDELGRRLDYNMPKINRGAASGWSSGR